MISRGGASLDKLLLGRQRTWTSDDFIVMSEFSEHQGPIPLWIYPSSAGETHDIRDFVVRIMAVHGARGGDDDLGCFDRDSQSMVDVELPMQEAPGVAHRWTAYVHQLTLLDVFARGYVRPVALSYLTREPNKIQSHFRGLAAEFQCAADALKRGNYARFKRDVENRIADLECTQRALQGALVHGVSPSMVDGSNLDELLEDLKAVRERVAHIQLDELVGPALEKHDLLPEAAVAKVQSFGSDVSTLNLYENVDDNEDRTPSVPRPVPTIGSYTPQVLTSISRADRFDAKLRSIEELCESLYAPAVETLECARFHFARPSVALELERADEALLIPHDTLITFGGAVAVNASLDSEYMPAGDEPALMTRRTTTASDQLHVNGVECFADTLWCSSVVGAGRGLLAVVQETPFANHMVASILRGRPLLVRGSARQCELIKAIVRALAVFVPRAGVGRTNSVCVWRETPIRLADLATIRLCGVSNDIVIPGTVLAYVSVFDVDEETLVAPRYAGAAQPGSTGSGSFRSPQRRATPPGRAAPPHGGGGGSMMAVGVVDDLLSTHRAWPDELAYLAFVHATLYELGVKAFLYYHLCCVDSLSVARMSSWADLHGALRAESDDDAGAVFSSDDDVQATVARRSGLKRLSAAFLGSGSPTTPTVSTNSSFASREYAHSLETSESGSLSHMTTPLTTDSARTTFFQRTDIADCDIDIIVYLSELLITQQEDRPPSSNPRIRLDFLNLEEFTK